MPAVTPPRITPSGIVGVVILTLLVLGAAFGPLFWRVDPQAQDLINRLAPPLGFGGTRAHPLGTDTPVSYTHLTLPTLYSV